MLAAMAILVVPQQVLAECPDDISAYQAQYEQRVFPPGPYPGAPVYARQKLIERLNYARAQYVEARQLGNRAAARYWKKEIQRLRRELVETRHAAGERPSWAPRTGGLYLLVPAPTYPGTGYAGPYMPTPYPAQIPSGAVAYGQPPLPAAGYAGNPVWTPFAPAP